MVLIYVFTAFLAVGQELPLNEIEEQVEPRPKTLGTDEIVKFPDIEASFPEGSLALQRYLLDQFESLDSISLDPPHRIMCSFVVEKDGSISNVDVLRPKETEYHRQIMKVLLAMPSWIPAQYNGAIVRSKNAIAVTVHYE
jgi:protein TonB